ncbi:MAG: U4/U6 small nuclear ribonucleoprotein prp4 [Phylliscum demangeonii]|nr:MAG: U4/U6 small nuclear ribonucleoprotein prp4 [Phylliscum demangeonii]
MTPRSQKPSSAATIADEAQSFHDAEPVDEAALIEERRRRRQAIKAKYQGQATPLLVQALQIKNDESTETAQTSLDIDLMPQPSGSATPQASGPLSPKDDPGAISPTAFAVSKDEDLAKGVGDVMDAMDQEGPSAADYNPTMDMREDHLRNGQRRGDEMPSSAYIEMQHPPPAVLLPESAVAVGKTSTAKEELDMFADDNDDDDDDMFAEQPGAPREARLDEPSKAVMIPPRTELDMSMLDDGDDAEGYYRVILGEMLDGRYHVQTNLGKGMFSSVVRALDSKTGTLVAIKIIRSNETMKKAGTKEIEILQKLAHADPDDRKHIIRLQRFFDHKSHLCMVFENLSINLREVLKKFGRDVGINLRAVRAYAQQTFLGLSLLRKCNILHADLKPDNILVNEGRNQLKICDLGSASDASENEITPYLVSRFYRAPEIILGLPYDFAIDVWSVGCTLYELYTGKILFTGRTNNQMLRSMMECRGKFSHKLLRKAQFAPVHFDDLLNFKSVEKDKVTGRDVVRTLNLTKPVRDLKAKLIPIAASGRHLGEAETKELLLFADLLDRCLSLNAEKRCTPSEALRHPFLASTSSTGGGGGSGGGSGGGGGGSRGRGEG